MKRIFLLLFLIPFVVGSQIQTDWQDNYQNFLRQGGNAYAFRLNQDLRTTDSPTFAGLTLTTLTMSGTGTLASTAGNATFTTALTAASGNEVALSLNYTTNKAAGNDTGLQIVQTDTASPGTSYLINALKASVSEFYVTNAGLLSLHADRVTLDGTNSTITVSSAQTLNLRNLTTSYTGGDCEVSISDQTKTNTSGSNSTLRIKPTYNQASGTASNTDLLINRTQTAVGSGAQLLIDAQVGSASKFKVDNTGAVTATANIQGTYFLATNQTASYGVGQDTQCAVVTGAQTVAGATGVTIQNATYSQTSGTNSAVRIYPTYNQASGTAANTDLLINRTQTAVGSGAQLLFDAQVGSVSKFSVDNGGSVRGIAFLWAADECKIWESGGYPIANSRIGFKFPLTVDNSTSDAFQFYGAAVGELTDTDAQQAFFSIKPNINQSATAGYEALEINVTETATGSGPKYLVDAAVGSARRVAFDNKGFEIRTFTKVLTDGSATDVFSINVPAGSTAGGIITYTIDVTDNDASDDQIEVGTVNFCGLQDEANWHTAIAEVSSQALESGTLGTTWAIDTATANTMKITCNADSNLTTPVITLRYTVTFNEAYTVTTY